MNRRIVLGVVCVLALGASRALVAQTAQVELIRPSETEAITTRFDAPNMIVRPAKMAGAPILLWMAGTHGEPENTRVLMQAVAGQGYRAVGVEYNDVPAVGQVCPRSPDPGCAGKFREMRVYGTGSAEVTNSKQESIVARFVALVKELQKRHPEEGWGAFLTADGQPVWSKIAVAGQSQGAGMAAFIAKKERVLRVVLFSSPVDSTHGTRNVQLAPWLSWPSATPPERWYAERNSREPFNAGLTRSYPALGVPVDHVRVFSLDLPSGFDASNPMAYHAVNIRDTRYLPEWKFLFGEASGK